MNLIESLLGIVIKQSSISGIFTYLGAFIGFINTFVLFPAFLSEEQIGLIRVLPSIAFMAMPMAQLGLTNAIIKFSPEFKRLKNLDEVISFSLVSVLIGAFIVTSLIYLSKDFFISLFRENSVLLNEFFYVAILLVFILTLYTLLEVISRILLKIIMMNFIKEILVRVFTSIAVSLYFIGIIDSTQLISSLLLIYGTALLLLAGYLIHLKAFKLSFALNKISKNQLTRLVNFCFFSIIGSSGAYIILNVDQIMISSILNLKQNGIYTTSFFFAVLIEMSKRAVNQITTPLISNSFENNEISEVKKIYQQLSINQMVIGALLYIGIVINIDNVYAMMPSGDIYAAGKYIVVIIGMAKFIDMTFSNNGEIIVISKYYKFNVVSLIILSILLVVFNWLLIPIYGINGAALGTLLATTIFNLIKMIFLKMKLQISPFRFNNLKMLGVMVITLLVGLFLPKIETIILDSIYRSVLVILTFVFLVLSLNVSPEITGLYKKYKFWG